MYRALQKEFKRLKNKLIEINNRIAELNRERRASAGQENFFEFDKELKIFKRNREDIEDELAGLDIELQSHKQVNVVLTLMEEIKRIDEARDIKLCEKLSSILEVDSKFIKITESEPGKDRLVVILPKGLDKELISLYRRVDKRLKSLLEEFGVKDVDLPAPPWKEKSHIESVYSNLFVGREEELRKFQEMIQEHFSTPIWCIHTDGDGGIGKTQLLFQILHQCNESDRIVNCQSMIDFYSVESCSKIGLIQQVMKNLSYDGFFLETKKRINLYESTEDASERETYLPQIEEYFFEEYQEFAHKVRKKGKIIVLLFDTYEAIQLRAYENGTLKAEATSFTKWLEKDLFPKIASHTRLIVAGRYPLNDLDGKLAVTTKLKKFKYEDTIRFWLKCFDQNDKQGLLDRLSLEETGMYKFHTLADGRPILLALFVDWVKYHRPILPYQWLSAIEEEQGEIGKEASPDQKRRFEKALVERFRQIDPMERIAVTYMAIAYKRMTPEMLHNLTKYPLVDCQNALLKKLRPLSFIKYKGNGIVLLHDEMQRLIIEHWWDEQDLDRVIRKKIAQDLVDYYKEEYLSEGKEKELPLEELETYMSELIEYKFLADSEKGLERFQEEFDHGMSGGRPDYVDLIIREADDYFQKNKEDFDFPGFLRISLCQVQYYIDTNRNYELALKEINKVFSNYMDKPDWLTSDLYGHFLLQQGRAHFWLEEFDESINALTKAKRVLYLAGMDDDHYWANHWMGYVYMRQGEFAQAEHWIQKSLDGLYELIKTKGFQNLTRKHRHYIQYDLGNLAIIYRTLGQFDSAIRYGEIALGIVRQLHRNRKEIARVRTTVGHAMAFAEYEIDARHHFDEAEKSIQGIGDRVLHGRLKTNQCWLKYRTRDFAYLLEYYRGGELLRLIEGESGFIIKRERFYKAVDLANEAIELLSQEPVIKKELADAYFTLGELFMVAQQEAGLDAKFPLPLKKPVTRANAKWKKAEAALVQAYQWGEKSKFKYRVVDSLESLITLYYFWNSTPDSTPDQKEKNRENITHYQKKFDAYNKKEMEGRGKKNYPNLFGKYEITLGDMEFDRALKLVEHPNSNLDSIAQALKKSFGHYVEAVRLMERFHIGRYYLILRILYNRLHSLFECLSPKEHMYKIAFDLIEARKEDRKTRGEDRSIRKRNRR
ncbi:MAG: hypothetical protein B6244_11050 [Candidatus Cloacimonetes bacterium 4572_55]|nr:MAG: hypothetical protein B6244_11050 [Candidatus Cloacimonetes bacterium 4572_55]